MAVAPTAPDVDPAHTQHASRIRLEWGPTGGAAICAGPPAADIAVVVDVLSFTTTLSIATRRGTRVHPFPWKDERAAAYAAERRAVLAVGRFEAQHLDDPPPSLSPATLLASRYVARLVLPSPNGSTICAALRDSPAAPTVVGASLRNRTAVADWLAPRVAAGATVAVVPAGERWTDGSLRPAVEDLWGAGAVLDRLLDRLLGVLDGSDGARGPVAISAEVRHAVAAYRHVADQLAHELRACASGQELVAIGFGADVAAAAELDADEVVPVLTDDGFAAAPAGA